MNRYHVAHTRVGIWEILDTATVETGGHFAVHCALVDAALAERMCRNMNEREAAARERWHRERWERAIDGADEVV